MVFDGYKVDGILAQCAATSYSLWYIRETRRLSQWSQSVINSTVTVARAQRTKGVLVPII